MPVASVACSACAFIHASISTAPVPASTVTQGSSPSGPKRGSKRSLASIAASGSRALAVSLSILAVGRPHEREELLALGRFLLEHAREAGRHRRGARFLHAAHGHAQVLGLD